MIIFYLFALIVLLFYLFNIWYLEDKIQKQETEIGELRKYLKQLEHKLFKSLND